MMPHMCGALHIILPLPGFKFLCSFIHVIHPLGRLTQEDSGISSFLHTFYFINKLIVTRQFSFLNTDCLLTRMQVLKSQAQCL